MLCRERAVKSGFDFIDFWAVDFDWQPGQPFHRDWQDYRTRKDRSLRTVSDAGHVYDAPGKYTICVKVVDVFGCDTSIMLTVEVWLPPLKRSHVSVHYDAPVLHLTKV